MHVVGIWIRRSIGFIGLDEDLVVGFVNDEVNSLQLQLEVRGERDNRALAPGEFSREGSVSEGGAYMHVVCMLSEFGFVGILDLSD